jgi:hypothetical protein
MRRRRPTTIGVPYGGLVQSGRLRLSNGQTIDYPQPDGGNTWMVRHPAAPGQARTAEQAADDAARGFEWRDHAIIAGRTKMIHGKPLGAIGNRNWLYCDTAGCTWVVGAAIYRPGDKPTHLRIDVWLYKRFGFFGSGEAPAIDRLLATRDFIPTWDDEVESVWGGTVTPPQSIFGYQGGSNSVQPITNPEGNRALICVMGDGGDNSQDLFINISGSWRFLSDVFEVQLSGTGTSLRDVTGTGISAAIAHTHTAADLLEQVDYDDRDGPSQYYFEEVPCTDHDPLAPNRNGTYIQRWVASPRNTRAELTTRLKLLPFWRGGAIAWVETKRSTIDAREISLSISGERVWDCLQGYPYGWLTDTSTVSVAATGYGLSELSTIVDGVPVGGYRSEWTDSNSGSGGGFEQIPGIISDAFSFFVDEENYIGVRIWPPRGDPKLTTNNLLSFEAYVTSQLNDYHLVSLGEQSQEASYTGLPSLPAGLTVHPETGEIAFGCWV